LLSVDKMNVLETTQLWRDIAVEMAPEYPDVELSHMLVDNCADATGAEPKAVRRDRDRQHVRRHSFRRGVDADGLDRDAAVRVAGMRRARASTSRSTAPHPDIAGQGKANPLAMILSMAMMFKYTFDRADIAARIEKAVRSTLASGLRTGDIATKTRRKPSTTAEMGNAVVKAL
jgi:3-isopropylmalate dehydrogenase